MSKNVLDSFWKEIEDKKIEQIPRSRFVARKIAAGLFIGAVGLVMSLGIAVALYISINHDYSIGHGHSLPSLHHIPLLRNVRRWNSSRHSSRIRIFR